MIFHTIQEERVPALGFGTYTLRGRECSTSVEHAIDLGYRHIDTAQAYANEVEVGRGIAAAPVDRDEVFLTTKIGRSNLQPERVRTSTEKSLHKLGTPYVDLLLIHWPDDDVPLERTLAAMLELQNEGKTLHIGVSNFSPRLVERAAEHAPIFCNQVEFHPFLAQDALTRQAEEFNYLLTAYSPIARGRVSDEETLREIGRRHGKSAIQVTLRWLIQQPNVAAIPKASSTEHRAANFDIFDFELTEDEMDHIAGLARGSRIVDPAWAPAW